MFDRRFAFGLSHKRQHMSGNQRESQSFLLRLSDALRPLADPVVIAETAMRLLGEHLQADRAHYYDVNETDRATTTHGFSTGLINLPKTFQIADFGRAWPEFFRKGRTMHVGDLETDARFTNAEREIWHKAGLKSAFGVPLLKDGRLRAILGVSSAVTREWTDLDITMAEDVAERIWSAVERARAEKALRESESMLAGLLDQLPVGVGVFDANGRYTFRNPQMCALVGQCIPSRDAIAGRIWEGFDVEGKQIPPQNFPSARALRGEAAIIPTTFRRRDDQQERWLRVTAVPSRDPEGKIVGGVSVVIDVTEERRTQLELRALAERNAEIYESISDAFYAVDKDWRFTYVNRKAEELWMKSREELLGKNVWEVFPQTVGSEANRALVKAHTDRQVTRVETMSPLLRYWVDITAFPSADGGLTVYFRDITPRRQAEIRLRESESRFREFAEASPDVIWLRSASTLLLEYISPAFQAISGMDPGELLGENDFEKWLAIVHPDDRERMRLNGDRLRAGQPNTFEFRIVRPIDGAVRWIRDTSFPLYNDQGKLERVGGISHDVTELRHTQDALAEREHQLRILMEGIPQLVWRARDGGRWMWASPQWQALTGQDPVASQEFGWLDVVHPEDREVARRAWSSARENGQVDVEYRVRRARDGAWLWHHSRSLPAREEREGYTEWLGTSTDVQAMKALQSRQGVLVAELQRRTRNLMTVVRTTMERSQRASTGRDDFIVSYSNRLDAIARAHHLLARLQDGERVSFDELLLGEIAAVGAVDRHGNGIRVTMNGVKGVRLRSASVQTLALALHELATNALKYGALAQPGGHLTVSWNVIPAGEDSRLQVRWRETGVPVTHGAGKPDKRGFGRELIETLLPHQLHATTTYELASDGLICSIDLALFEGAIREDFNPG